MRPIHVPSGFLMLCAAGALPAAAAEFCLQCEEPAATYRCTVVAQGQLPNPPSQQMYCLTELARQGGHTRCTLRRGIEATCDGLPRSLFMAADSGWAPVPEAPPAKTEPGDAPSPTEPATVQDMVEQDPSMQKVQRNMSDSAKSAGDGLKKAGEAVGNAAKKSWECVTSLFKQC